MEIDISLPSVYISHSQFFHKDPTSTSGLSINGKISRVSGSNLDEIEDIITGLPVSDHDHGINAIEFGNNGELYIAIGGNTNGGKPGKISSSNIQKESYLSSAIVVAYLQKPNFNGFIKYTKADDGDMVANGIEVFAHGLRNPFGLAMHSNGKLYATDNGPNKGYGSMATGCGETEFIPGREDKDKIILAVKGAYYGQPNHKRAIFDKDPRQCIWYPTYTDSVKGYTQPIATLESSMNGLIEYNANYFDGQLRGNLIASKYGDELYRIVLTPDGNDVISDSKHGLKLFGDLGLDLTLALDGTIIEARYNSNNVYFQKPIEAPTTSLKVLSVFPYRGSSIGGNVVSIYGINFMPTAIATVGGLACTKQIIKSPTEIECKLPGGLPGSIDVIVSQGSDVSTFVKGYRYITGMPL